MLLWRLWRWLFGWVRFEAEGGLCERFLNLLAKEPIELWDIRHKNGKLLACCPVAQYRALRPFARRTGTRVRLRRKSGLPFWLYRMRHRKGLAVGAVCAAALYLALGSRIWVVEVHLDDPTVAAAVAEQVAAYGVAVGEKMQEVDIASLRLQSIATISEINWLSVHFEGSIAHVEASMQKPSTQPESSAPSNLIASSDGRIVSMQVTGGQAMVQVGEGVVKGDLLVCGAVDTTAGTLFRRSCGSVIAETTHTLCATAALSETQVLPDGRVWRQPTLRLFSLSLPLYTVTALPEGCEQQTYERFWRLRDTTLPIGLCETVFSSQTPQTVVYTEEQAEAEAAVRLAVLAETALAEAEILRETLQGTWENGVYTLTGTYTCREDIAQETPLLFAQ